MFDPRIINKQQRSMAEGNSIDSLLSTSGEEDLDSLSLFYQAKIFKRISKEEIQGWGQPLEGQPFQKKEPPSIRGRRPALHTKNLRTPESLEMECLSPQPSLNTIKHNLQHYEAPFPAFRTLHSLPAPQHPLLPKVRSRQEPKDDFVKGRKFTTFKPVPKKITTPVKQLEKTLSGLQSKRQQLQCRCVSVGVRNTRNRDEKDRQLSIISYPVDVREDREGVSLSMVHRYMRRCQWEAILQ